MLIYFRLCKAGYARSVPEAATLDVRTVVQALHYESFCAEYEYTYLEKSRKS